MVLNQSDAIYAHQRLGVVATRIHRVPNGLSAAFLNLPTPDPCLDETTLRLAMVGSFIPRKGIATAVPALTTLLFADQRLHLSLVGTGVAAADVLATFPSALHDRIMICEEYLHDDLPQLLRGHHMGVLPTLYEGHPLALLEMMACGLACVTTDVPGPRDTISDGDDGLLVPPGDEQALLQALVRLAGDGTLRTKLRIAAHRAAQQYAWPHIVNLDRA